VSDLSNFIRLDRPEELMHMNRPMTSDGIEKLKALKGVQVMEN
jgi:hypothetical protein